MSYRFLDIASTPSVQAVQARNGHSRPTATDPAQTERDRFTAREAEFIALRDSFYLATTSESGWPYIQHRGGPPGFLHMLDDRTLGFLDFRGNRQFISIGNASVNDRAALFLMDYVNRRRLKIFAHLTVAELATHEALAARLALPDYKAKPERAILLHLDAFDWNCPQHITPRFTEAELSPLLSPLRTRITELEAENQSLRAQLQTRIPVK